MAPPPAIMLARICSAESDAATVRRCIRAFPGPSRDTQTLLKLARHPELTEIQVVELLARQPVSAERLMRAIRSPLYGFTRHVSGISQVVHLLGPHSVVALSLSLELATLTGDAAKFSTIGAACHRRSLLTALTARALAIELHANRSEDFMLVGLLQDIGVLIMALAFESNYSRPDVAARHHRIPCSCEHPAFGPTHADIGAQLLRDWGLPQHLVHSTRLSHTVATLVPQSAAAGPIPTVVATAACIADALVAGAADEAFAGGRALATGWLHLGVRQLQRVVVSILQQIPCAETVFGVRLMGQALEQGMTSVAREILPRHSMPALMSTKRHQAPAKTENGNGLAAELQGYRKRNDVDPRTFAPSARSICLGQGTHGVRRAQRGQRHRAS